MKYRVFTYEGSDKSARPGIVVNSDLYDLRAILGDMYSDWQSVDAMLQDWEAACNVLRELAMDIDGDSERYATFSLDHENTHFLPPLVRCGVIYGAGANYRDHALAMAKKMNTRPILDPKSEGITPWHFIKAGQATLTGHKSSLPVPEHTQKLDWEAELAVFIGKRASKVSVASALEYVGGYSIANDLSARDYMRPQFPESSPFRFDWVGQKCFNDACPIGPFLTPSEYVESPEILAMKLWVNDEIKQDSNTSNHIFSVAEQISHLSHRIDLLPGDILLTGTPSGVGAETDVFLKRGDVVRVWIDGLGELETRIS